MLKRLTENYIKVLKLKGTLTILIVKLVNYCETTTHRCGLLNMCNRILRVSFFIPLAGSVEALEFDSTFFMPSRSFALTGTFSTSRQPTFFDRVSNHDG